MGGRRPETSGVPGEKSDGGLPPPKTMAATRATPARPSTIPMTGTLRLLLAASAADRERVARFAFAIGRYSWSLPVTLAPAERATAPRARIATNPLSAMYGMVMKPNTSK